MQRKRRFRSLSTTLLNTILGFSLLTTVVFTGFYVLTTYAQELFNSEDIIDDIFTTQKASLIASLWSLDKSMIQVQLEGLTYSPTLDYVEIRIGGEIKYFAGVDPGSRAQMKVYSLSYQGDHGEKYPLGLLTIKTNPEKILMKLLNSLPGTLGWQISEKTIMALILIILLKKVFIDKVKRFSDFFERMDENSLHKPLVLKDAQGQTYNELDQAAEKLNIMRLNLLEAFESRKQVEAELLEKTQIIQNQITQLELQNSELQRFSYTVSHDLKSPLITIQGFAQYLYEDMKNNNLERAQTDINKINNAIDKMNHLLNDLLEMSRVGKAISDLKKFPMEEVVKDTLELLEGVIKKSDIKVSYSGLQGIVTADRLRIQEVWQNLIENSIKYRQPDQVLNIEIGIKEIDNRTYYFLKDTGKGIEPNSLVKIFGLFEKLDPTTQGTGIGLALVKRIITLHGGDIYAQSEGPSTGTTFFFTLEPNPPPLRQDCP